MVSRILQDTVTCPRKQNHTLPLFPAYPFPLLGSVFHILFCLKISATSGTPFIRGESVSQEIQGECAPTPFPVLPYDNMRACNTSVCLYLSSPHLDGGIVEQVSNTRRRYCMDTGNLKKRVRPGYILHHVFFCAVALYSHGDGSHSSQNERLVIDHTRN